MTEDRFDEMIRDAARDYHRPGDVPRERMWERVQAARATPAMAPRRGRGIATWAWAGFAAAALLTVGIGIGRWMERSTSTRGAAVVASRTAPDTGARVAASPLPVERGESSGTRAGDAGGTSTASTPLPSAGRVVASTRPARATRRKPSTEIAGTVPSSGTASLAYRVEVAEHFASTEALLTSFRATARSNHARVDPQLASWTRNLLATTRMLQASAPRDDPTMTRLLDDLELVLMQIDEYTSGDRHRAEDARLIEQAIERHAVMTRLRTNPAGITSPGT